MGMCRHHVVYTMWKSYHVGGKHLISAIHVSGLYNTMIYWHCLELSWQCEVCGSDSDVMRTRFSGMWCDVCLGKDLLTFQRFVVPSCSWSSMFESICWGKFFPTFWSIIVDCEISGFLSSVVEDSDCPGWPRWSESSITMRLYSNCPRRFFS